MSDAPTEGSEKRGKRLKLRKILVGILVVVTCLSIVVTTVDTWAHRTLLNTDAWVETVAPLGTKPQVTAALATYVTDQIVTTLDLEQRAHDALAQAAPQAAFLAGPITNAIQGFVHDKLLEFSFKSPAWETFWTEANRVAHEQTVNILRGHRRRPDDRERTGDPEPLARHHRRPPTHRRRRAGPVGQQDQLPQITGTEQVSQAIAALSSALDRPLPPDFGQIVVFQSDDLAQGAGRGQALRQAHVRADPVLAPAHRRHQWRCR